MYPLLACSVISLAVIIERGIRLAGAGTGRRKIERIQDLAHKGMHDEAGVEAGGQKGFAAVLCAAAIRHRRLSLEDQEEELSVLGSRQLKGLTKNMHLLELVGKIAPMLGLSGTVLGLAETFQTVARLERMANPSVLAGGIWQALITTVVGLFIGIPSLIFYHLYENRIRALSFEMKTYSEELLKVLRRDPEERDDSV